MKYVSKFFENMDTDKCFDIAWRQYLNTHFEEISENGWANAIRVVGKQFIKSFILAGNFDKALERYTHLSMRIAKVEGTTIPLCRSDFNTDEEECIFDRFKDFVEDKLSAAQIEWFGMFPQLDDECSPKLSY